MSIHRPKVYRPRVETSCPSQMCVDGSVLRGSSRFFAAAKRGISRTEEISSAADTEENAEKLTSRNLKLQSLKTATRTHLRARMYVCLCVFTRCNARCCNYKLGVALQELMVFTPGIIPTAFAPTISIAREGGYLSFGSLSRVFSLSSLSLYLYLLGGTLNLNVRRHRARFPRITRPLSLSASHALVNRAPRD